VQQGFRASGQATVSESVSEEFLSVLTLSEPFQPFTEVRPRLANANVFELPHDSGNRMKQRFILFRRNGVFYCEDTTTGKQTSLRTKDEAEANTLLHTRNEAVRSSSMNLHIAQVYLQHRDSRLPAALGNTSWMQ
jgi:hypothetical protein